MSIRRRSRESFSHRRTGHTRDRHDPCIIPSEPQRAGLDNGHLCTSLRSAYPYRQVRKQHDVLVYTNLHVKFCTIFLRAYSLQHTLNIYEIYAQRVFSGILER